MEKKIKEVHDYFLNKITACDFELERVDDYVLWLLNIRINGHYFSIFVDKEFKYASTGTDSFMKINIPKDRLENIKALIQSHEAEAKQKKIAELQEQLKELEK